MKRHFEQHHGQGWEISYVCCDTEYSCRTRKYSIKEVKAHFAAAHPDTPFELGEDELGLCSTSYNDLQEKIIHLTALPPGTPADSASSSGSESPPSPPQPLQQVMSVAARARNAPRYQRREEEPHLTPPRQPLPGPAAAAFMDPPTPDPAPPLSSHPAPGSASTTPRPAFVTRVPTWLSNGAG